MLVNLMARKGVVRSTQISCLDEATVERQSQTNREKDRGLATGRLFTRPVAVGDLCPHTPAVVALQAER